MFAFIVTAVWISLTGVLAPGPVTAATMAAGTRNRHAGSLIALGHIAVELPAMALLLVGLSSLMKMPSVQTGIGLAGGVFLLLLGIQLFLSLRRPTESAEAQDSGHPFWVGVVLTGSSPYFWLWAATVGLTLANQAIEFGLLALALFAVAHWLVDVGWLEALSLAGFKGSQAFGPRSQRVVSAVCAVMLVGFGLMFLYEAGVGLSAMLSGTG